MAEVKPDKSDRKRVTLREVAQEAGVSLKTASNVINHSGRMADAAYRHVASALSRLADGGRLVAITGANFSPDNPAWAAAFTRLQARGRVVFTAAIDGSVYAKHGTTIDTRLTVIDKAPAEDAVARANAMKKGKKPKPRPKPLVPDDAPPVRYPVRAFVQTWGELANWWTHYDIAVLAAELTDDQYENFLTVAEATARFADDLRTAREAHGAKPILRAL